MQGESLIDIVDPTSPISPEELSEIQLSRRVLDRLDEETEEDTDVASSRPSSRLAGRASASAQGGNGSGETDAWEDLEDESASGESAEVGVGQTRKPDDEDDEDDGGDGTIGGSETSGRRTMRSFGATRLLPPRLYAHD